MSEGLIPRLKRVLPIVIIGCVFFGITSTVLAQGGGADSGQAANTINIPGRTVGEDVDLDRVNTAPTPANNPGGGLVGGDAAVDAAAVQPPAAQKGIPLTQLGYADQSWYQVLFNWVVAGFGWLVAQFGHFLDYSITKFIVGFGTLYNSQGVGIAIDQVWGTVRDIFNLTFIFGLVYIGFQIILGSNDSQAKQTIPKLILAALLVNFSLFITKFIVDFSNIAATQIFNLFKGGGGGGGEASLSIQVLNLLGMSQIFQFNPSYGGGSMIFLFGMLIILTVMAYVFLAGGIMITIRFVALNIYMVFSPVMFLGWVFPGLSSHTKKFWQGFLGQAFFAPAFLFMLYLSFMVLDKYNDNVSKHFADVFGKTVDGQLAVNNTEAMGQGGSMIPFFALTTVFLIASIIVARKIGFTGGDMVISGAEKARKWAQGAVGTAGMAAAGAGGYAGYKGIDKMANSENAFARTMGRSLTFVGARDKAEKTYKGSLPGKIVENRKKKSGEMATRGEQARIAKNLSSGMGAAPGTPEQIEFEKTIQGANQTQLINALRSEKQGSAGYNKIIKAMSAAQVNELIKAKDDVFGADERSVLRSSYGQQVFNRLTVDANRTTKEAVPKASADDLVALSNTPDPRNPGSSMLLSHAEYIPAAKMDDLKSKLVPTEYANLENKRKTDLITTFRSTPRDVFSGKKDNEIARLPKEILQDPRSFQFINPRVLEIILRENYLDSTDRAPIKAYIQTQAGTPNYNFIYNVPMGQGF